MSRDDQSDMNTYGDSSRIVRLKLMPEVLADEILWYIEGDNEGLQADYDSDLPQMSATLLADLERWNNWYTDAVLEHYWEGEWDEADVRAFEIEGVGLWRRVRAELGEGYHVSYFSETRSRLIDDPAYIE